MIRKAYILILFHFITAQVITNNSFNTSRSISMAGATVSNPGSVESVFYNPANLSNLSGSSFLFGSTNFYEQNKSQSRPGFHQRFHLIVCGFSPRSNPHEVYVKSILRYSNFLLPRV